MVTSKIRSDALAFPRSAFQSADNNFKERDLKERELTIEESIYRNLNRIKQVNINEEPFTFSLRKVHDRSFINKLLPLISNQQNKYSP